ncbi:MAG: tyrosine-type recombinase/integrase [bacterium]|nr:tyrosine-type recombinase/integrase [bacterium]
MKVFNKSFVGKRNYLLVVLAFDAWLRLGELLRLSLSDIDIEHRMIYIRKAKSRKPRVAPIGPWTAKLLLSYIERYRKGLPGDLLFCKGRGQALNPQAIRSMLRRAGKKQVSIWRNDQSTPFDATLRNYRIFSTRRPGALRHRDSWPCERSYRQAMLIS